MTILVSVGVCIFSIIFALEMAPKERDKMPVHFILKLVVGRKLHLSKLLGSYSLSFSPERIKTYTWLPGQTIPFRMPNPVQSSAGVDPSPIGLQTMVQTIQATIDSSLQGVKERLSGLEVRLKNIEENQAHHPPINLSPNGSMIESPSSENSYGRRRRSPPELQVCWLLSLVSLVTHINEALIKCLNIPFIYL